MDTRAAWDIPLTSLLGRLITTGLASNAQCQTTYNIIHSLCKLLGVPPAKDMREGPCTLLEYLGFLLDTINMTVSPSKKPNRLIDLIQIWRN